MEPVTVTAEFERFFKGGLGLGFVVISAGVILNRPHKHPEEHPEGVVRGQTSSQ